MAAASEEGERSGGPSTRLKRPSGSGNLFRQTVLEAADVTTIDEINMANKELVEKIDDLLNDAVGLMDGSGVRSLFSLFDMYNSGGLESSWILLHLSRGVRGRAGAGRGSSSEAPECCCSHVSCLKLPSRLALDAVGSNNSYSSATLPMAEHTHVTASFFEANLPKNQHTQP